MATSVNIFITDTQLVPQPISGVVVNVYNGTTLDFVTAGTSDVNGQAAFSLPGASYELRFFKSGVIFTNPKSIAVLEPVSPPDTNDFNVSGTVISLPVATDSRMCRCTGQFIDFSGQPINGTLVRVVAILGTGTLTKPPNAPIPPPPITIPPPTPPNMLSGFQAPKVIDGKMVSASTMEFRTDLNGKVSFDLIRQGQYYVAFAGEEDTIWPIVVPDRSSVNLIDLIHPQPVSLTWNSSDAPGNAVSVAIGQTKEVNFSVLFSNFQSYATNLANIIQFTNSDGTKADVVYDSGRGLLTITGKVAGSLNVTVAVIDNMTPARIPAYSITAVSLAVTITP
jgi:hypothetical protein